MGPNGGCATFAQRTVQSQNVTLDEKGQTVNGSTDWTSVNLQESGNLSTTYNSQSYNTFTEQHGAASYESVTANGGGTGNFNFTAIGSDVFAGNGGYVLGSFSYTFSYGSNGAYARDQVGTAAVPQSTGAPYLFSYEHTDNWGDSVSLDQTGRITPSGATLLTYDSIQSTTEALTDQVGSTSARSNTFNSAELSASPGASAATYVQKYNSSTWASVSTIPQGSTSSTNTLTLALPSGYLPSQFTQVNYVIMPTWLTNAQPPAPIDSYDNRVVPSLYAIGQELPIGTLPGLTTRTSMPAAVTLGPSINGPLLVFTTVAPYGNWLGQQFYASPNWLGMQNAVAQYMSLGGFIWAIIPQAPSTAVQLAGASRQNPAILFSVNVQAPAIPQAYTGPYTGIKNSQAEATAQSAGQLGWRMFAEEGETIAGTLAREGGPALTFLVIGIVTAPLSAITGGLAAAFGATTISAAITTVVATTAVGAALGYTYGGLTGEGDWDSNKALAGAISGGLIGAGVGVGAITFATPFAGMVGSIVSAGLTGAGMGGLGTFQLGQTVDGTKWFAGTVAGGVAGLVGAAVSQGTTLLGQYFNVSEMSFLPRMTAKFALGFADGVVTDLVFQGVNYALGGQDEFSFTQLAVAGGIGGVLGLFKNTCFTGEMPIPTLRGNVRWDELRLGDRVQSGNEYDSKGRLEFKLVEEIFVGYGRIWHLHVAGRTIRTTAAHRFFVFGKGWVRCDQLHCGDLLRTNNGRIIAVGCVYDSGVEERVYNCRVEDYHTYFIGSEDWGFSVWAHNECTVTRPGPSTDPEAPHNAAIRALGNALEALGNKILAGGGRVLADGSKLKEKLISTLGGFLDGRRPDILYQTPTGEIRAINVGRTMADGTPVPREVRALADLNGPGGIPTMFVPF